MPGQSTVLDRATLRPRVAQGCILEAIASGTTLRGEPAELIDRFGVAGGDLLFAILDLLKANQIILETGTDGRYLISSPAVGGAGRPGSRSAWLRI